MLLLKLKLQNNYVSQYDVIRINYATPKRSFCPLQDRGAHVRPDNTPHVSDLETVFTL